MTPEEEYEAFKVFLAELVQKKARELGEHVDAVQIFVSTTRKDGIDNNLVSYEFGVGNFHARLGQVHEFIAIQDQYQRNWATRKEENE